MRNMMDEQTALGIASHFYDAIGGVEGERRLRSPEFLEAERLYFQKAMVLQVSAFPLLDQHFPFTDPKQYAASALGFSIFDHLRQGWLSLEENYCLVSMTIARNIFEAVVFLTAIGVGTAADFGGRSKTKIDTWLARWWKDEFEPGTVLKLIDLVDKEMSKRSTSVGKSEWARSSENLWRAIRGWAHANWVPIARSGVQVKYKQEQGETPAISFGGQLSSPEQSKVVGYLYAHFAVDAVFALGLAFTPQLADHSEWWRRKDTLMTEHHKWSRSIDSRQMMRNNPCD
jgi:hypothetical protein